MTQVGIIVVLCGINGRVIGYLHVFEYKQRSRNLGEWLHVM